ncbi:alpha/beta hydrolase domain-containing protein [Modestobacter sp. VKM Ac-2978]|uniref:alpha/beta hydrolase domain-containing protein n=1 Tax=Modestobacter sp. VKM Ac-2978 TaxID=3004132 RepID=UPI0022AAF3B1|nr:alpha/beta hydrolase domain-containing protein [Modestobacter sp. VKM Ac-2978]MCZ2850514.1 alpha/beta hydrolase domain-containing protein [Modestobacter sp. VKM Ac-2978]
MHRIASSPPRARAVGRGLLVAGLVTASWGAAAPAVAAPTPEPVSTPADGGVERTEGPVPQVSGPLPSSDESHPFGGAAYQEVPEDLGAIGYTEEEFLASGTSNVYSWPEDAPAVVRTADAPYTTRVLVRRPADADDFSGNVVVEMLNPSNLFDLNIGWALAREEIIDNGDAWVGITAKPIAVDALKTFDAERYGSLSFANPLPVDDPANCSVVDADADPATEPTPLPADTTQATENGLVWDIYTQVGNWLRSDETSNPLTYGTGGTAVERAYGFGYSQTGGYLINYMKAVHPLVVAEQSAPTYDAYLVGVAGGGFAGAYPMNQCEPAPPVDDPRRDLYGIGVPVIQVMSQSDYLRGIGSRRPDSDIAPDQFRHYEMAGAGHATPFELYYSASSADIVAAGRDVPPQACNEGPRSRFPSSIFFNAALNNLDRWVRDGVAPPRSNPIVVERGEPVLDEFGNVLGGLRSPFLDVPTSTWFGTATGASFCFIAGYEVPFEQARLDELYSSHRDYVTQVTDNVVELQAAGFLTYYDAYELIRQAKESDIG